MASKEVTALTIRTLDPTRRPVPYLNMKEQWDAIAEEYKNKTDLKELVRDFFAILDIREDSEMSGKTFAPNYISSCRVFDSHKLNAIIPRMKELAQ